MYRNNSIFFIILIIQIRNSFMYCITNTTHSNNYRIRIICSIIIKRFIISLTYLINLIHIVTYIKNCLFIKFISHFHTLKISILILSRSSSIRPFWINRLSPKIIKTLLINQFLYFIIIY